MNNTLFSRRYFQTRTTPTSLVIDAVRRLQVFLIL